MPFSTPRDLPDPGIKSASLTFPALAGRFFTTSATWEVLKLLGISFGVMQNELKAFFYDFYSGIFFFSSHQLVVCHLVILLGTDVFERNCESV